MYVCMYVCMYVVCYSIKIKYCYYHTYQYQ